MILNVNYFPFCLLLLIAVACSSQSEDKSTAAISIPKSVSFDTLKTAILYKKMALNSYQNECYSLYIPTNNNQQKKHGLVLFIDPQQKGAIPVKKYKELADKYQVVLVGSTSLGNGKSLEQGFQMIQHLLGEIKTQLPIDTSKILLCGFSGGAKQALYAASLLPSIKFVAYIGACTAIQPNHPINLIGFAGKGDMNYASVLLYPYANNDPNCTHYLIPFVGKHEWPPVAVLENCFKLLQGDTSTLLKPNVSIKESKLLLDEQQIQQQYAMQLQNPNSAYWKTEINRLKNLSTRDISGQAARHLGFISLACYSYTRNALLQNQLANCFNYLSIYRSADPENADVDYFYALYYFKMNQDVEGRKSLLQAIKNGFSDKQKLQSEPAFSNFLKTKEGQQLLAKME